MNKMVRTTKDIRTKMKTPKTTICTCGRLIKGTSEKHLKANLKAHKASKMHKEIMRMFRKSDKEDEQ